MFITNKLFTFALALTILQQVSLAMSTYFIALAGEALSTQQYLSIKSYIIYFFTFALLAYLISSASELIRVKVQNATWKKYVFQTFNRLNKDISLSSANNNKLTTSWLTGEAAGTIEHATAFYIGMSSTYFNIIFTLTVFYLTLGHWISSALLASLIISIIFVVVMRTKINEYATNMQKTKLQALVQIEPLWHNCHFASSGMFESTKATYSERTDAYFSTTEKYVLLEQLLACLPICAAVIIIIVALYLPSEVTAVSMGVLVAVLPRTLQLFGSVHALSMYGSQFVIVRQKIKNLIDFTETLDLQDIPSQINIERITIKHVTSNQDYALDRFQSDLINERLKAGRYIIQGKNGTGKSSLLKLLKSYPRESILISPDINFSDPSDNLSTGQRQMKQMSLLLAQPVDIFLLDEWDANLDKFNMEIINNEIEKASIEKIVIEVRHSSRSANNKLYNEEHS